MKSFLIKSSKKHSLLPALPTTYKVGTLFSGGEGVGEGVKLARILYNCPVQHVWGLDHAPKIVDVARMNGHNVILGDIRDAKPNDFEDVHIIHASTMCQSFSESKQGGETTLDVQVALAVLRFVEAKKPLLFTLENVRGYMGSDSEKAISAGLESLGYSINKKIVCFANYGLPQKRYRLILLARLGDRPLPIPEPTHKQVKTNKTIDMLAKPWLSWYEAIEDLIPTLEPYPLSNWQARKIKYPLPDICFIGSQARQENKYVMVVNKDRPMITVTTKTGSRNRIYMHGRTLKVNMRCVARWQGFDDSYILPKQINLSSTLLGNAVSPKVYAKFIAHCVEIVRR